MNIASFFRTLARRYMGPLKHPVAINVAIAAPIVPKVKTKKMLKIKLSASETTTNPNRNLKSSKRNTKLICGRHEK